MGYKVFVDFEMAPIPYSVRKEKGISGCEIIQIGAVILDNENKEVGEFKRNIRPLFIGGLPNKYVRLLGLTYDDLVYNCKIEEGLDDFAEWIYSFSDDFMVYAWSNNDLCQLNHEIKIKDINLNDKYYNILGSWFDLQEEYDQLVGAKENTGLKRALETCGIEFEGKEHDSLFDSRNTSRLYIEMRNPEELLETINKTKKYTQKKADYTTSLGDIFDFSKLIIA